MHQSSSGEFDEELLEDHCCVISKGLRYVLYIEKKIIIWFGDTVIVSHSTKCDTKLKSACSVVSMLNQIDAFLCALQKYLNQKRKTSNQSIPTAGASHRKKS